MAKTREIESKNGKYLIGDGGRSRGWYHMRKSTWEDVSRRRAELKLPVVSWVTGTKDRKWCDTYADDHARWLARQLSRKRLPITEQALYICWNCGLSVAIDVRGESSRLGPAVQRRLRKFSNERLRNEGLLPEW